MNRCELTGTVSREPKTGSNYAFFSLRTDEERSTVVDVACFDADAIAAVVALKEGDEVRVIGRVGSKEDKKLSEAAKRKVWVLQVVGLTVEPIGTAKPDGEPF